MKDWYNSLEKLDKIAWVIFIALLSSILIDLIKHQMKKRTYNGCELSSPTYRQIVAEIQGKNLNVTTAEHETKRGKRSKIRLP